MRTWSWTAGLAVVIMAAAAQSASATATSFDVPLNGPVANECTEEVVVMTGTIHFSESINASPDDSKTHLEMNLVGVKGITATGVRYTMSSQTSDTQHADIDPEGDALIMSEASTVMNRQGESFTGLMPAGDPRLDDYRLHVLMHLTVSNGEVTPRKMELRADCR